MLLTGQVFDNQTGNGIPYASVQITDYDAQNLKGGVAADQYGHFQLDSPLLDGGAFIYVSSTGYLPILVNDGVFQESGMVGLDQTENLPPVIVTPHNNSNNNIIWFILVGGGLALMLAAARKEKGKKVGALQIPKLNENKWIDIGLKIGIPVALYFLVVKPILVALNLLPDKREQAQNQSDGQAQTQQGNLSTYNSSDNHSYSASVIDGVAIGLRNDTAHAYGYNWPGIAQQLTWIPGMTSADARYFLGTFVKKNAYTLYRWYQEKFSEALILAPFNWRDVVFEPHWWENGTAHDYSAFYKKMGINESNADSMDWWEVVKKFVDYVYTLAGVTKQ